MSDFVYKQMINKVDNTPITGGSFFLRNVETLDEFVMTELPDDPSGSSQGRYVTDDEVPNGVYKIFRVVSGTPTDTGDEVHVEPCRVNHGGSGGTPYYPVTSRVVGDVVHAVAFLSDDATYPTIATINQAMAWAVTNGYSKVCVGTYKGDSSWSDSIQLQIPAGIKELDLAGASIECTTLNLIPVVNSSGVMSIHDGVIQGNGTGSTSHVRSESAIVYYNVRFVGFGGGPPVQGWTTSTGSGTPTKFTIYMGCTGVRVDAGRRLRSPGSYGYGGQIAIGGEWPIDTATQTGGTYRDNIIYADVDAGEATAWFRSIIEDVGLDPVDVNKFASVENASKALKSLWFGLKNKFVIEETSYVTDSFSGRIDSVYASARSTAGTYDSNVSILNASLASSSPASGFVQGAKITRRRFYGESKYSSVSLKLYLSFDYASFIAAFPIATYSSWRPKRISIPSSLIKSILVDVDGTTSILPGNGAAAVKPVMVNGIHSLTNLSTGAFLGTTPVLGGVVSLTADSPERFAIDFSPVTDDNTTPATAVIQKTYPMIGNYLCVGGFHLFEIEMTWNNPAFTSIPGPR